MYIFPLFCLLWEIEWPRWRCFDNGGQELLVWPFSKDNEKHWWMRSQVLNGAMSVWIVQLQVDGSGSSLLNWLDSLVLSLRSWLAIKATFVLGVVHLELCGWNCVTLCLSLLQLLVPAEQTQFFQPVKEVSKCRQAMTDFHFVWIFVILLLVTNMDRFLKLLSWLLSLASSPHGN